MTIILYNRYYKYYTFNNRFYRIFIKSKSKFSLIFNDDYII